MCGIVGIVGHSPVAPLIVDALKRLEYRGYDSAGVATIEHGVATIPFSAFYANPGAPALVRLCFAKRDETLDRGAEALIRAKRALS